MRGLMGACALFCGCLGATRAEATAQITIDLSSQTMHVSSASGSYSWPVSTARFGYRTPRGSYRPYALARMHYSHKYHMSPMPHSIFFAGGYAIHGTYETGSLGRPASHGCVRLSPGHAAALYQMVQAEGGRITITGSPPVSRSYAMLHRRKYPVSGTFQAAWHHSHHHALAYAPARRAPPVRAWQTNPVVRSQPQQWFYQ